jgi:iron only hydrogenase large subunit-like protein
MAEPGAVIDALHKLGFTNVVEAAEGAMQTTALESEELIHKINEGQEFMTTSCCPSWVLAANKHIPDIVPFVSGTPSPMAISAKKCKEQFPGDPVVFIGPCIAKRKEGRDNPDVDWVMTFEELACLLNAWNISVVECENLPLNDSIDENSRKYCLSGSVAAAVQSHSKQSIQVQSVNGLDKKQLRLLRNYARTKKAEGQLIEVMACEGGCISGPCSHEFPKDAKRFFAQSSQKFCTCTS